MRWTCILLVVLCASARAQAETQASSQPLVGADASFHYQTRVVEVPQSRYGLIALHDFDSGDKETRPPVVEPVAPPPQGWPSLSLANQEGTRVGKSEFSGHVKGRSCRCATDLGDGLNERVAILYATTEFQVDQAMLDAGFELLELNVRYNDGLAVHINGQAVTTRNLSDPDRQSAERIRGPESERFLLPMAAARLRLGTNLLAIEVRPSAIRQVPTFSLEMRALHAGEIKRGPMVQRAGEDSATILFDSDFPAKAYVEYGVTKALGSRADSAGGALARHHRVRLAGLSPGVAVYYRVVLDKKVSQTFTFHSAPLSSKPLRFAVYGDMRGGHRTHGKIVAAVLDEAVDFVVSTGDLVLRGNDEADWQRFFKVASDLLSRVAYYPVAGNHDLGKTGEERRRMHEIFDLWPGPADRPDWGHWYSFTVSNVHFVMLDSNSFEHAEQLDWLEADLSAARNAGVRAIFAAVHDGPYSRGLHRGNRYAAEHYVPVLRKHSVDMLFAGHDHLYQRGEVEGLPYIVSGGAGAPLYPVRCGVPGKQKCKQKDGMRKVERVHHYVIVTVFPRFLSVCPKRVDKSAIEPCLRYSLSK